MIHQEEGSSSVGEGAGDYPIQEKPIVEVGAVAKEKSPEQSTSSSTSQSDLLPLILPLKDSIKLLQEDVFSPMASLSHNDCKAFVLDKFLLWKESHDALEPVGANTELRRLEGNFAYVTIAKIQRANRLSLRPIMGAYEEVNKLNTLFKTDLSTEK
ncbi:unnamed protein product [Lepeophtheirus salmonis]|uniref:(salmon louse) hypothetical protein n=1 Tax=Lepeophtheirus salmonis TaxID=72036 RepID=A0A7R8CYG8_LEPSM|nr:unnamed protein product [Lepeophtheirus salmonis]CAF2924271.1 unnamed protein product [Lepeophtheirus salmonis]